LYFLCGVQRSLLKLNKKSSIVFEKKNEDENFFYKSKKLKAKKNIFVKFEPKRSAPKWAMPKRATKNGPCQKDMLPTKKVVSAKLTWKQTC